MINKKLTWLLLFSVINWVFYPSESYASRNAQGSNTHSFSVEANPYKYSSYYLDSESRMYYLKARYYSPELMLFISRDTYDLSNRYAYCDGNPITQSDPDGHSPVFRCSVWGLANLAGTVATAWELEEGVNNSDLKTVITSSVFLAVAVASSLTEIYAIKKMLEASNEVHLTIPFDLMPKAAFSDMEAGEVRRFLMRKGTNLGAGKYGVAYEFEGEVFKFFKNTTSFGLNKAQQAAREARIINELEINKSAGFTARTTAKDGSVLVTPLADMTTKVSLPQCNEVLKRIAKDNNRLFLDCNPSNIGVFHDNIVVFDTSQCTRPRGMSRTSDELWNLIIMKSRRGEKSAEKLIEINEFFIKRGLLKK